MHVYFICGLIALLPGFYFLIHLRATSFSLSLCTESPKLLKRSGMLATAAMATVMHINTSQIGMYKYTWKSTSQENSAHRKIKLCILNYMNSEKKAYFHNFSLLNPLQLHLHLMYVIVKKRVCFK